MMNFFLERYSSADKIQIHVHGVINMNTIFNSFVSIDAAGLGGLFETLKNDWLAPIFLAFLAVMVFRFLKNQSWRELVSWLALAVVVGVVIFGGDAFFGQNGRLTNTAENLGNQIDNTSVISDYVPSALDIYSK